MKNELTIIRSAQQGNPTSFARLVTMYQNQLNGYLVTKCYNPSDAEDIVQETFINAYKYIQSYKEEWKFSTWLYTIANRMIKKHNDYYSKDKENFIREDEAINEEVNLDSGNIWIPIRQLLSSFAFDIIWFYYVEDYNVREIARILHCSQSRVKMSLFRSKRKLAKSQEIRFLFQKLVEVELLL